MKTNRFINEKQHRCVVHVKNINGDVEIEIDVIFDDENKTIEKIFMFLTMMTKFGQMIQNSHFYFMFHSFKYRDKLTN